MDRYTAYEDLTVIGFRLPDSARRWALRLPAAPRRTGRRGQAGAEQPDEDTRITLDGGLFFVAGYSPGGVPYGIFSDAIPHDDPW